MKRLIAIIGLYFLELHQVFASKNGPEIVNAGLPKGGTNKGELGDFFVKIIELIIELTAVLAVFALIFSGFLYLFSAGDEEKDKKARKWIIWSLLGVIVSVSAWGIIKFLNGLSISI